MIDLEQHTARDKKQCENWKSYWSPTHLNYIVLVANPGLSSCENLAMALAVRQAGQQMKYRWVLKFHKILYRFNYSGFYFVYYYYNVATVLELHFSWLLSSKVYFKVCFEVQKIW